VTQASTTPSGKKTKVSVYYSAPAPQFSLPTIAKENGYFPDDLDVDVQGGDSTVGLSLAGSGRVQFYVNAAPVPEQIASGGAKIKWLAQWQDGIDIVFIGRPGIDDLAAMKGKKLGIIQPGLTLAVMGDEALKNAGLGKDDYTAVSLGTLPAVNAGFASGAVYWIVTDRSSAQKLLKQVDGSKILFDFYGNLPWIGIGVTGNTDWVADHPQQTVEFLQGLNEALKAVHADPAKTKPVIGKLTSLTGGDLDFAFKDFQDHSTQQLEPVAQKTEDNVMDVMAAAGNKWATPEFAKSMIGDPKYVQQATGQ
jgi:ABC-type nitrate/sulfonate/bicarbonate transport system substrate-binding protein